MKKHAFCKTTALLIPTAFPYVIYAFLLTPNQKKQDHRKHCRTERTYKVRHKDDV